MQARIVRISPGARLLLKENHHYEVALITSLLRHHRCLQKLKRFKARTKKGPKYLAPVDFYSELFGELLREVNDLIE